jgi:hypothetical protein
VTTSSDLDVDPDALEVVAKHPIFVAHDEAGRGGAGDGADHVGCRDGQQGTAGELKEGAGPVVPMRKYEMETSELVQIRVGWCHVCWCQRNRQVGPGGL